MKRHAAAERSDVEWGPSTVRAELAELERGGYLDHPQDLKVEDVEQALAGEPDLTARWLDRGHDQRLAGGWGIECENGTYRIQSFSGGGALEESDPLHATAEFVVRYVGFIGEVMRRYA